MLDRSGDNGEGEGVVRTLASKVKAPLVRSATIRASPPAVDLFREFSPRYDSSLALPVSRIIAARESK